MRVLHVITRMIVGGAQENTLYNCLDLIELFGDDVLLATGPSEGPEGELLGQGRGARVPRELVPALQRNISPPSDWAAYRALQRIIRRFQPDVVHTHSAKGGVLGRLAAWSQRVPVIVHTVHGAPFYPYQNPLTRRFYQGCEWYAARRCHALISVADAMTDLMVSAGVAPRAKFTTIYSGMEVEPFLESDMHRARMRAQLGYSESDVVIGKIARLFELKGHDDVIAAARQVCAAAPQAKFLFIGDGALRNALERQIAAAGLTDRFQFTGLIAPREIPAHLSACDLVVHASLREGLARALPQALLAGKPVISYDIDGAREVTITDQTGFLIPPRDLPALAEALTRLVLDSSLRTRLGATGRERFADQFRHETMTRRIRALYQQLLENASNPPANS